MSNDLSIVYEDERILVVNKPADLVCHPTKTDPRSSLIGRVRLYLGPAASGELHLINRLDRETSGIVLIAKDSQAARAWRQIWEKREIHKEYAAIVHGRVPEGQHRIDAPLGKDETSAVAIRDWVRSDGAPAITAYALDHYLLHSDRHYSLLRVSPLTGRKHQIRIHLAYAGYPIVGDKIYGPDQNIYLAFVQGQMTEAQRVALVLPWHALHAGRIRANCLGVDWDFRAKPEEWFRDFIQNGVVGERSVN